MAATKRTTFEIECDRAEIAQRYLRRQTQHQIAEALGISRHMVQDDLEAIQERWRKDTTRGLDQDKARELARIDELERTYWQAWERSQQEKESFTQETESPTAEQIALMECAPDYDKTKPVPRVVTKEVSRREGQSGNPAFLAGVMTCIDRRCKLLGLDPPIRTEVSGKDGNALVAMQQVIVYLPDNGRGDA